MVTRGRVGLRSGHTPDDVNVDIGQATPGALVVESDAICTACSLQTSSPMQLVFRNTRMVQGTRVGSADGAVEIKPGHEEG
jgi:hypothetical protein